MPTSDEVDLRVEEIIAEALKHKTTVVDLSDCDLETVPSSLRQIVDLDFLNLNRNKLTELPLWFSELKQMRTLYLRSNQLTELSELVHQLSELPELQILDLSGNGLPALPKSLSSLKSLTELYLHNNPDLRIPAEI